MTYGYIPFRFGTPFRIADREVRQKIIRPDLRDIHGFFGMIGPDINTSQVASLYELFTGDGIINGVFFQNGTLTYVNHFVRTEKLLYEEKHGRMPKTTIDTLFFMMTQSLNLFPNCIDVANTVLLRTRHAIYALFERDSPYRIQIQSESQTIHTEYKDSLGHGIGRVCAHSKYDDTTDTLETIDYHVAAKKIQYRQLDMSPGVDPAELLSLIEIPVKYMPITHDFIALDDSIIVLDSPFSMSVKSSDPSKIPLTFHNDLPTYFYVVNKRTREIDTYTYPEGIFIFHYAWTKVGEGVIEILAPVYRGLDINALDLKGTYSKLVLTKLDKTCRIHTTESLKPYNLEFPVRWEDSVILRHFHEKRGVGFVICNDLDIQHCIWLPKLSICGEPVVIHHLSEPWILCFTSDDTHSYISLLSMRGSQHIHIPILDRVQVGFHSIYLP